MNIILVIRRHKDYYLSNKIVPCMSKKVYLWNFFFRLPYITFRHRLRDISATTYLQNKFDKIYLWAETEEFKNINKEDSIVVPIDEDDWISTSLTDHLRSVEWKYRITRWEVLEIDCENSHCASVWEGTCPSCSYATMTPIDNFHIMQSHVTMSECKYPINKVDKILAVKLDNFASISWLCRRDANAILDTIKNKEIVTMIPSLREFEPQVKAYNDLLLELYDSCKIW